MQIQTIMQTNGLILNLGFTFQQNFQDPRQFDFQDLQAFDLNQAAFDPYNPLIPNGAPNPHYVGDHPGHEG